MAELLLSIALRTERDVVQARQRARELAAVLGFDNQDQIRLATATSEMARNAFRYARNGLVTFSVSLEAPQHLEIAVSDTGSGIPNLEEIFAGRYKSDTGMGMGILGTQRLMDDFKITTGESGTTTRMVKLFPPQSTMLTPRHSKELTRKLQDRAPDGPYEEIERQNQELLKTLQELRAHQEELTLLNRELEDTNRGVVALYAELDERADYLRRASELKTKFLSNVSHEFRTPLNSVISLSRMLMERIDGDLTPEQEKQVRYIESSARDLQEMVNDLLDLAKVEAGKIKIRVRDFEVQELFSALKGMLKPLLADNNSVDLIFEEPADVPPLRTDEGKVSQILRNLISNALKFTPQGRIAVSARTVDEDRVVFEVSDTGIGIPVEYHEAIFAEFSQVENPLQERHRGTGLGLPLCRNLALLLGGRLWLESELGRGSTFFVELPSVYVGETGTTDLAAELPAPEFHRAPVLILEDNPQTASLLESYLRHSEFQPILVKDIAQAESWVNRHTPAAVISDIYVGDETSWAFVSALRDRLPLLPVVVTSAFDEEQQALTKGANLFLLKPVQRDVLLQELRQLTSFNGTRRLLIVDDNEVSRYIVKELLDRPWLEIFEASCGTQALQLIRENQPDAVILDLLMPDISGLQVLRLVRQDSSTEKLPVLIYTSKTLTDAERQELAVLKANVLRKEEISTRLSVKPFMDWLASEGISSETIASEENA